MGDTKGVWGLMDKIPPTCEIATCLSVIERRLRDKAKTATSEIANAAYVLGACEIRREALVHHRQCKACQSSELQEAA